MSCFIVSDEHINTLVTYAVANNLVKRRAASTVARLLFNENVRSFVARYNGRHMEDVPKTIKYKATLPEYSHVAIVKQCNCYDYQACETSDYEQSAAAAFVTKIRKAALKAAGLPEGTTSDALYGTPAYEAAPWGL